MACSKHGSRSVDAIWNNGSLKLKELLVSKLCQNEAHLNSDQYGRFVSNNLGLNLFKRSKEQVSTLGVPSILKFWRKLVLSLIHI